MQCKFCLGETNSDRRKRDNYADQTIMCLRQELGGCKLHFERTREKSGYNIEFDFLCVTIEEASWIAQH